MPYFFLWKSNYNALRGRERERKEGRKKERNRGREKESSQEEGWG